MSTGKTDYECIPKNTHIISFNWKVGKKVLKPVKLLSIITYKRMLKIIL
jgi:hypothetical protein